MRDWPITPRAHAQRGVSIRQEKHQARKAFFGYGSIGAFQGNLNPISSVSVIETCVLPALLYGAENWILTRSSSIGIISGRVSEEDIMLA